MGSQPGSEALGAGPGGPGPDRSGPAVRSEGPQGHLGLFWAFSEGPISEKAWFTLCMGQKGVKSGLSWVWVP
jgi:hypothetical protein